MIRHSSSFFISLLVHTIFIFALFSIFEELAYKNTMEEKKYLSIELCKVSHENQNQHQKQTTQKKIEDKKIIKKELPKVKQVKRELPKVKPIKKELLKVKPVKKEIKKPQENPLSVDKPIVAQVKSQITIKEESDEEKNTRLQQEYIDKNIQKIRELIVENLYYPLRAKRQGIVGKVIVKFHLSKDSNVNGINVVSSDNEILSRAAIKTIENLSNKFPSPQNEITLHVPIIYKLNK
jgi:periplasmic protein TonB